MKLAIIASRSPVLSALMCANGSGSSAGAAPGLLDEKKVISLFRPVPRVVTLWWCQATPDQGRALHVQHLIADRECDLALQQHGRSLRPDGYAGAGRSPGRYSATWTVALSQP